MQKNNSKPIITAIKIIILHSFGVQVPINGLQGYASSLNSPIWDNLVKSYEPPSRLVGLDVGHWVSRFRTLWEGVKDLGFRGLRIWVLGYQDLGVQGFGPCFGFRFGTLGFGYCSFYERCTVLSGRWYLNRFL